MKTFRRPISEWPHSTVSGSKGINFDRADPRLLDSFVLMTSLPLRMRAGKFFVATIKIKIMSDDCLQIDKGEKLVVGIQSPANLHVLTRSRCTKVTPSVLYFQSSLDRV